MPDFITSQQPEIIFASICGPAASLRKEGLPLFLYAVYTFPAYLYSGFPECSPRANNKKISELASTKILTNTFQEHITGCLVLRDDEFLRSLWRGSLWPVVSLFSPVSQVFSDAGSLVVQNKEKFLNREAVKRWVNLSLTEEKLSASIGWSLAERALNGEANVIVKDAGAVLKRLSEPSKAQADKRYLRDLYEERKDILPPRPPKHDLNNMLITLRGLS